LNLTSTNQDFLRAIFGDEINSSNGKLITLRAVQNTITSRGVDTSIIGLPKTHAP
jgi:hypothetical protein